MRRVLGWLLVAVLCGVPATAQEIDVSKIFFGSTTISSGTGSPEGVVSAAPGSLFLRTDSGQLWRKASGTGNTGWEIATVGQGTSGTIAKWAPSGLTNSIITESGTTISIAGALSVTGATTLQDLLTVNSSIVSTGFGTFGSTVMATAFRANTTLALPGDGQGTFSNAKHLYWLNFAGNSYSGSIGYTSGNILALGAASGVRVDTSLTVVGSLLFSPTATHNIGSAAGSKPQEVFVNNTVNAGGAITAGGSITAGGNLSASSATLSGTSLNMTNAAATLRVGNDGVSGAGIDIGASATNPSITAFDRTGAAWLNLRLRALSYEFQVSGTSKYEMDAVSFRPAVTDSVDIGRYDRLFNQAFISTLNATVYQTSTATLFGGYSIVGKQAGSFAADVAAAATTINFGQTMTVGNWVQVRAHDTGGTVKNEYLLVGSNVSGTTYNVTRDLAAAHGTDPAWASGTPFLVLGAENDGRIEQLAFDGKPRIAFIQQGSAFNTQKDRCVLGNLNGYYSYVADIYGLACGSATGPWIKVDPTNGVQIGHNATTKISLNASGDASFSGAITSTSGTIGGFSIGVDYVRDLANSFGLASDTSAADDVRFWAGATHANRASAPLRLTEGGVLTAVGAVFTGSDITLGSPSSTLVSSAAVKFSRPTGSGFGASGDVFALGSLTESLPGIQNDSILIQNRMVGTTGDGNAVVKLSAIGWEGGASVATTESSVIVRSSEGNVRIDLASTAINLAATSIGLTGAVTVTGAASVSSTLGVTGATTLTGGATVNSGLTVTGATTLSRVTGASILTLEGLGTGATTWVYTIAPNSDLILSNGLFDRVVLSTAGNVAFDGTITERSRSTAIGEWTTVAHAGGNFTASGSMTWTVDSADQTTFAYALVGKTVHVAFSLASTDVGGTAAADLRVAIPGGFTAAKTMFGTCQAANAGGVDEAVQWFVAAGGTTIGLRRMGGVNWSLTAADNTDVRCTPSFEIQ